jgi:uncharacterized membrane protein
MFYPEKFINKEDEGRLIKSIRLAEKNTSGEICVHLQKKIKGSVMDAALKAFKTLKLDQTASKNGVLIFIVPSSRQFAILGDKGINDVVPENFWDDIIHDLQGYFRSGEMVDGLCVNIEKIGEKLKAHFPYQDNDVNELPDEISYA